MTENDLRKGLGFGFSFFPSPLTISNCCKEKEAQQEPRRHTFCREDVPRCCPCPRGWGPRTARGHGRGHPWRDGPWGLLPPPPPCRPPALPGPRRRGGAAAYLTATRTELSSWPADMVPRVRQGAAASLAGSGGRCRAEEGPAGEEVGALPRLPPLTSSSCSATSSLQPF